MTPGPSGLKNEPVKPGKEPGKPANEPRTNPRTQRSGFYLVFIRGKMFFSSLPC